MKNNKLIQIFPFLVSLLTILIFIFILVVAYLPNRPNAVDYDIKLDQISDAKTIRAEGIQKLKQFIKKDETKAVIPIERAKEIILSKYRNN